MKRHTKISLVLRIQHSGRVDQKIIKDNDKFTLGQRPDNDLTLFGQEYPKKHTLFERRNGSIQLYLPGYVKDGEIRIDSSVLNIKDLMVHDVLPREKNNYVIKLSPNKQGFLTFGDTRIDFLFDRRKVVRNVPSHFSGFSWVNAAVKSLFSDLMFKFIFLVLFTLNAAILYLFKDYEIKVEETIDIEKVQQRFAKFILKTPEELMEVNTNALNAVSSDEGKEESGAEKNKKDKSSSQRDKRRGGARRRGGGNPAASAGLLSLIGGTGSVSKSSSVVDALVDRGLVADLKNILGGGTNLKVGGKKTKDDSDPLDQLIGTGGSGGIDDFLASMDDDVEEVTLRKKVRVNLSKATSKSGDAEAMGQRSEQSVRSVVNARMGRITWLYEKYLKRQPNLRGKVSAEITIAANGFVTSVKILESTINHPQFERDIINLLRRLKFEPIPEGTASFVFPFVFNKMN